MSIQLDTPERKLAFIQEWIDDRNYHQDFIDYCDEQGVNVVDTGIEV